MKASSSFKLKKETKRMLATVPSDRRGLIKNIMINAQVAFEQAKRESIKQNRNKNGGGEE
jgi:hypothetical protein